MRILVAGVMRDSNHLQQLLHPLYTLGLSELLIHVQRLSHDILNEPAWVQRPVGILKNDLHVLLEGIVSLFCFVEYVLSLKIYLSLSGLKQVQYGIDQGGFAAAGFADYAQHLTLIQLEADIVHSLKRQVLLMLDLIVNVKIFLKVLNLQQPLCTLGRLCFS